MLDSLGSLNEIALEQNLSHWRELEAGERCAEGQEATALDRHGLRGHPRQGRPPQGQALLQV